jgi:hypothetical protein
MREVGQEGSGGWHVELCQPLRDCHASLVVGTIQAPDLRRSPASLSPVPFRQIVKGSALAVRGMPSFGEFPDDKLENLRQYIVSEAAALGKANSAN